MQVFRTVILILLVQNASSQTLSGVVSELGRSVRIGSVLVLNTTIAQSVFTDNAGKFAVHCRINDLLIFSSPGYISDTIFVTDLSSKRVYLTVKPAVLAEVQITGEAFDPRRDYGDAYTRGDWYKEPMEGGITISPSRLFGKKGKNARRLQKILEREKTDRQIYIVFTKKLVTKFIPLTGKELDEFMFLYKPTLKFTNNASNEDWVIYINKCWKRWKEGEKLEKL